METNNDTWMTHGKHGNDRGDWPLSIVVFEDDPYISGFSNTISPP